MSTIQTASNLMHLSIRQKKKVRELLLTHNIELVRENFSNLDWRSVKSIFGSNAKNRLLVSANISLYISNDPSELALHDSLVSFVEEEDEPFEVYIHEEDVSLRITANRASVEGKPEAVLTYLKKRGASVNFEAHEDTKHFTYKVVESYTEAEQLQKVWDSCEGHASFDDFIGRVEDDE